MHASASAAAGPVSSAPTPAPQATHSLRADEEWQRRQSENKAFRLRKPLSPAVIATNQPCADAVRAGLERLRAQQRFDAASITEVLTDVGLEQAIARKAGRLDVGGASDGLLFAGSTGQACVFGEHGPNGTDVELGSGIADGGCLPAAD